MIKKVVINQSIKVRRAGVHSNSLWLVYRQSKCREEMSSHTMAYSMVCDSIQTCVSGYSNCIFKGIAGVIKTDLIPSYPRSLGNISTVNLILEINLNHSSRRFPWAISTKPRFVWSLLSHIHLVFYVAEFQNVASISSTSQESCELSPYQFHQELIQVFLRWSRRTRTSIFFTW